MNDILQAYGVTRRIRKKKNEEDKPEPLSPEQEESLIGKLGRNAIGTVGAVGNLLDLPGSMVRDVAALKNPLDQLLTPFNDSNRVTGRDLNRKFGLAGQQDTWKNFGGGMATEIALDPLTYLTFGASALGKGGQVAKAAGLMPKAVETYAKKAGRAVAKTSDPVFSDVLKAGGAVGKREARAGTTLRDLIDAGGTEAMTAATNAAKGKGLDLNNILDEKLGGSMGVGLPFMDPLFTLGGTKTGKLLDDVGAAVRYAKVPGTDFAPIHETARLFDYKSQDMNTPLGRAMATKAFDSKTATRAKVKTEVAKLSNELEDLGLSDAKGGRRVRQMMEIESARAGATPGEAKVLDEMQSRLSEIPDEANAWGIALKRYVDDDLDYFPRQWTSDIRENAGGGKSKPVNARHGSQLQRKPFLRGIPEGTDPIIDIGQNAQINALIDSGATQKEVANALKNLFGTQLPPTYKYKIKSGPDAGLEVDRNRYKAMAKWLGKLSPETRKSGIFGNHAVLDYQSRLIAAGDAITAAKTVVDTITQPGILMKPNTAVNTRGTMKVAELLDRSGLQLGTKDGGIGYQIFKKQGIDISQMSDKQANAVLKNLASHTIDEKFGQDITRYMEAYQSPEPTTKILEFIDNISNFWKGALTTPWPAFHTRNLVSGQWDNVMAGTFSPQSVKDSVDAVRGKVVKDASKIAAVQQEWARRGGQGALADDEATKILGEMAHGHGVIGKFDSSEAMSVAGRVQDRTSHNIDDTLSGIPGIDRNNFSPKRIAKKSVAMEKGTNAYPWAVRGVGGRMKSEFGPMAAGEELGFAVETMNRLAPWIHQLRQGVDPAEAAAKVGAVQVLYQNRYYSKTEQQVLQRMFPFYKFSSRKLPYLLNQLIEHPGGMAAQTIRTMENAHDPSTFTPDHVTESAAIPVQGTPLEALTGKIPEGHDRYISGLGLSIENPLGYGPGLRGAGLEVMSQMNPLIKAPLEYATGQTFFQKTPTGGRPLGDLDPMTGRLIANLTGSETPVKYPGGSAIDFLVGNSPLSRVIGTANMLTDQRRGPAEKALNVLTGIKTKDVSPAAKDALERDMLTRAMKDYDAKKFTRVYISKEDKAKMTPEELAQATQLEQLMDLLAKRAKERKAEKAK